MARIKCVEVNNTQNIKFVEYFWRVDSRKSIKKKKKLYGWYAKISIEDYLLFML